MASQEHNPLQEFRVASEYMALHNSPVFQGHGVPHGEGMPILVVPGLFGNDLYLATIRNWLTRIGYEPIASDIHWNVGCPKRLLGTAQAAVERVGLKSGDDIAIVGHSRGGLLAKALTSRLDLNVRSLVVVGSPLGGMLRAGPNGMQTYAERMQAGSTSRQFMFTASRNFTRLIDPDCKSPMCDCEYMDALFDPLPSAVKLVSIYSSDDPIVPPASSVVSPGQNVEVSGSHGGLMFNEAVYPHIADALAHKAG